MHELSVARSIVEACSERAAGARVLRVCVELGALSCVAPESLQFCFDAATRQTVLEGAQLEISVVPASSRCRDCGRVLAMSSFSETCACGSGNLAPPENGDQLMIKTMEIDGGQI